MYGYIYITTNLMNGRIYIGQKKGKKFSPSYYGSGIILTEAIKKYGKDNFTIDVVAWANNKEELNSLEISLINEYKEKYHLYNIAVGGDGGDTTSTHPNKLHIIQQRAIGLKNWHKNLSEEEKRIHNLKISEAKKGRSNGHNGLKHRPESIEKIKQANILFDRSNNTEWKNAHASAMAKRAGKPLVKKYKSVIINDIEYSSIKHAMEMLGIKHRATFYDRMNRGILKVIYK